MLNKILVAFLMAGLAALATAETVYKWVDGAGQIHYTDLPPKQADAKILSVSHGPAAYSEEEVGADGEDFDGNESGDGASTSPTTPEPPVSNATMAAVQDDVARARTEKCTEAKERYKRYIESRRLFREENGKRVYLTDQELNDARASAKQSVDEYCS